jgi:O-antigen/teichoic acid export membrane protein
MIARVRNLAATDFARHGALVFGASMLINALGYAFHFAISRKVGVEQYGVLAALNAGYMIGMVASTIVATIVVKYAAEFRVLGDEAHLASLARRLSLYGSLAAIAFIAAGIAAAPAIAGFLKISNVAAVTLCLVVMGISIVTPTIRSVFTGVEDFRTWSVSAVMESTLKAALGIGLVYAGYGVVGAFGGWAFGSFVTLVFTMTVLLTRFRQASGAALYIDVRRLGQTMAGVSAAIVLLTAITYTDVIIVKHYADATTAGLYGALSLSGKILLFFVGFVPTVLLPKASRQALAGESPSGILAMALVCVAAFSSIGLIGYYVFPQVVITTLAGPSFAPATPYVFSYGVAMVLLGALNTVATYKIGIHRYDFVWPLAVCTILELVGIALYHASLTQIVSVLIGGNAVALLASVYRINAPLTTLATPQRSNAAA